MTQPQLVYDLVTDPMQLPAIAQLIAGSQLYGLDIETASNDYSRDPDGALDPRRGKIRLVQFLIGDTTYVVDLFKTGGMGPLTQAMKDSKALVVGQNLKFEAKWFLWHYQIELGNIFDTLRADMIITNGKTEEGRKLQHHLYAVWDRWLGYKPQSKELQVSDWSGELTEDHYAYAAEDVLYLFELRTILRSKIIEDKLSDTAALEFRVVIAEAACELNGFPIDTEMWETLARDNINKANTLRNKLLDRLPSPSGQIGLFGHDWSFNIDSTDQILTSLQKMGLKQRVPDEATGTMKTVPIQGTSDEVLAEFSDKYPIIKDLREYRGYSQNVKMFGLDFLNYVNPTTGRIHTSYHGFLASGRYMSANPNLQQIPGDLAFRNCFRPKKGRIILDFDYSSIEVKILAEISQDKELIKIFNASTKLGRDIHAVTAAALLGKKPEEVTKEERQQAKAVNFGFAFGMMPPRFVVYAKMDYNVTFSIAQAKKFRNAFFDKYKGLANWHKLTIRDGQRTNSVRSIGGRIRYLKPGVFNEYMNGPVQSTGADALKRSLRGVYDRLKKYNGRATLIHHIHDEIILECDDDKDLIDAVSKDVQEAMIEGMEKYVKSVPIIVEGGPGDSWGTAH